MAVTLLRTARIQHTLNVFYTLYMLNVYNTYLCTVLIQSLIQYTLWKGQWPVTWRTVLPTLGPVGHAPSQRKRCVGEALFYVLMIPQVICALRFDLLRLKVRRFNLRFIYIEQCKNGNWPMCCTINNKRRKINEIRNSFQTIRLNIL